MVQKYGNLMIDSGACLVLCLFTPMFVQTNHAAVQFRAGHGFFNMHKQK